jgi:hypothetical protein
METKNCVHCASVMKAAAERTAKVTLAFRKTARILHIAMGHKGESLRECADEGCRARLKVLDGAES